MKNLGKILFTFLLLQNCIYASVVASVDSTNVELGDTVTLSISIDGEDIKRPDVFSICGENVVATGSSTSMQYVNGDYTKTYVLSYKFLPTVSCVIEPVEVSVGGKIEKTLPIDIKVQKLVSSKDSIFSLAMTNDVNEVYVGEPFELSLLFRQKRSVHVLDNKFNPPSFKGFWVKGEPTQSVEEDGAFTITKITYKLAPQRVGVLNIEAANIKIAQRENKRNYFGGLFPEVKWKTYFSNDINITSKALPSGVNLVGDFSLEALVDTKEVNPNEAVTLTIKLIGEGNLEDVKSFKPYIEGVSIFDEKIAIENNVLTQKITFVGDSSFTIPAFSLKTFNTLTNEVKTIQTQPLEIHVKHAKKKKEELLIKREEVEVVTQPNSISVEKEFNVLWSVLSLVFGILLGILIMYFKEYFSWERKKSVDLKDTKMLLVKLMPYKDNQEVKEIVAILESNLYTEKKTDVDKKTLKDIIKRYEID